MAQDWNIRARGHVCSACGNPLVDKSPVVSVLHEDAGAYVRLDCHPECWQAMKRDWEPFSVWEGVYSAPPPPDTKKEPLKKETADDLLRRLMTLDDPAMRNVTYVLAVMLERSKILVERDAKEQPDRTILRIYEHRGTGESFMVVDPRLRLDNIPQVQKEVLELLSGEKTAGEIQAGTEEKPADDAPEKEKTDEKHETGQEGG